MAFRESIAYYNRGGKSSTPDALGRVLRYKYQEYAFGLERGLLTDRQLYRYRVWWNQRGVSTPADPRELRYVNPTDVERETSFHPHFCWRKIGAVKGGDWDLNRHQLKERFPDIYRALEARYVEGRDWEDIGLVDDVLVGKRHWHHHRGEEIWDWCDYLDELYESISSEGYLPQRDVLGMTFSEACDSDTVSVIDWMDDIRIDIGRDGQYLRHDGKHRLWLAQLLAIDRIPVCVVVRHEEWQQLRDEIASAGDVDELSDRARRHLEHPDMVDVRRSLPSVEDPDELTSPNP